MRSWDELERYVKEKGKVLFDASRGVMFAQNVEEMDSWMAELQGQMVKEGELITPVAAPESLLAVQQQLERQEVSHSTRSCISGADPVLFARSRRIEENLTRTRTRTLH